MTQVNMHEAKTNLSKLVDKALKGEEVVLARSGKALVRLVPVEPQQGMRPSGLHPQKLSKEAIRESLRPLSDEDLGFYADDSLE